jgi:hypothetical protein
MMKLVLEVAEGKNKVPVVLEYRFDADENEGPFDCLDSLRGALLLTGSAVKSAKVIDHDSGSRWSEAALALWAAVAQRPPSAGVLIVRVTKIAMSASWPPRRA